MKCVLCFGQCARIILFFTAILWVWFPFGTQGNWGLESKSNLLELESVLRPRLCFSKLCFSEVSVAGPLKFQGELVRWASIWVSLGGCHFQVLPAHRGRVTQSSSGCGHSSWLAGSLCGAGEFLLLQIASVFFSTHWITSHPSRPRKESHPGREFFLDISIYSGHSPFNLPAN